MEPEVAAARILTGEVDAEALGDACRSGEYAQALVCAAGAAWPAHVDAMLARGLFRALANIAFHVPGSVSSTAVVSCGERMERCALQCVAFLRLVGHVGRAGEEGRPELATLAASLVRGADAAVADEAMRTLSTLLILMAESSGAASGGEAEDLSHTEEEAGDYSQKHAKFDGNCTAEMKKASSHLWSDAHRSDVPIDIQRMCGGAAECAAAAHALPSAASVLLVCPAYCAQESARWAVPLLERATQTLADAELCPVLLCLAHAAGADAATRRALHGHTQAEGRVLAALDRLLPSARSERALPAGLFLHALSGGDDARMAADWGLRRVAGFLYGRTAAQAGGDAALVHPDGSIRVIRRDDQ